MESLNPRIRTVWFVVSVFVAVVLAVFVGFAPTEAYVSSPVPLPLLVFSLLITVGVVYQYMRYDAWGFEVQEDAVYIEHGVLVRVKKVVPFVRIQHIDSRRGPVERASGLASLVIYTAGSRGADVSVPGLTPERADELRERLRELAIENEESIEDAV
jgi:membrane protein YdbS with pleckstrin-like domain